MGLILARCLPFFRVEKYSSTVIAKAKGTPQSLFYMQYLFVKLLVVLK
jgi:hypothetical protein